MNIKFTTTEKVLALIIVIGVIAFFMRECGNQKDKDNLVDQIANYKDTVKFDHIKIDGQDVQIAYNASLELENKDQIASILKKNDTLYKMIQKFKDLKSATIINQYTTINGDTIKLKGDSIPCYFKPIQVRRDSAHYHFVGTIAQKYFSIDTLTIPNKQSLLIGTKKVGMFKGTEGFFNNKEKRAEIVNSNPLVKVVGIQNYVVDSKKKFYERAWFHALLGMGAGAYVEYKLTH
jgi:hypothetical protein